MWGSCITSTLTAILSMVIKFFSWATERCLHISTTAEERACRDVSTRVTLKPERARSAEKNVVSTVHTIVHVCISMPTNIKETKEEKMRVEQDD